jgi:hypothetical protein
MGKGGPGTTEGGTKREWEGERGERTYPLPPEPITLHGNLDPESLEVNHDRKDHDRRDEVHHVRETFAPEGLWVGRERQFMFGMG